MSDTDDQSPQDQPAPAAAETPPPAAQPENPQAAADTGPSSEEKQWAMFAHLAALIGFVIPFGSFIGPLVVWQMKKAEMPFVDDQGKEALNFQITVAIALVVCFVLSFILIGLLLLPIVGIGALIFTIVAALKANAGEAYRYPISWRLVT